MTAPSILAEAEALVSGARQESYGHPSQDWARAGIIWGAILHEWAREAAASPVPIPVPPGLAVLCMVGVKVSREVNRPARDNRVDMAGYAACLQMIADVAPPGYNR